MTKVLITGSSGHLGCALMLSLPEHGYGPIGLDILPSETTTIVGSFTDRLLLARIFAEHEIRYILHAGTLHKPHVDSHTKDDFVKTNISGTLALLEEAVKSGKCEAFIFTSTTSTFGRALAPKPGEPAAWIDETVVPIPKNIYGATKVAAEDICELIRRESKMPILVLRTSRFFPEEDDIEEMRDAFEDDNLKVCELTYRRVDIADVVSAHICALRKAKEVGWGKYIISATPPFVRNEETPRLLDGNAADALKMVVPSYETVFAKRKWKFLPRIDRVYDSSKATRELEWKPVYTFERALECLEKGQEWRSDLWLR